jgi:hypothetical protein
VRRPPWISCNDILDCNGKFLFCISYVLFIVFQDLIFFIGVRSDLLLYFRFSHQGVEHAGLQLFFLPEALVPFSSFVFFGRQSFSCLDSRSSAPGAHLRVRLLHELSSLRYFTRGQFRFPRFIACCSVSSQEHALAGLLHARFFSARALHSPCRSTRRVRSMAAASPDSSSPGL